jgi:putative CocE/NonD family hydrolase
MSFKQIQASLAAIAATTLLLGSSNVFAGDAPKPAAAGGDIPKEFKIVTDADDYIKRDVMIPMRDGVKLHTVILIPKGAKGAPILLTRTPYNAKALTTHTQSAHLGSILYGYDNATDVIVEGGYIRVIQDVRGKYHSEGDYVMTRPLHGPLNPTAVDHSTDTYDTIDWLVKNIPESNGKVGILGISYDGFTTLMALVNPHPALKVAVPMNPMVDGWMGDDWFHNGAFREQNMPYVLIQEGTRDSDPLWWTNHFDDYDVYMEAGSAGELGRRHGLEQVGFWRKLLEHPSYDSWWQQQAMDRILSARAPAIPTMLVDSLWDQEDIYGAPALYKAWKPKDADNKLFLVLGPWHHGQEILNASSLGAVKFNSDTGLYFRQEILRPFLDKYLKDGASTADIAPVNAFETGSDTWRRLPAWPAGCTSGCSVHATPLYLSAGSKLSLTAPATGDAAYDEYISDPAKPVPFRARPIQPIGYDGGLTWPQWLVDDQREASGRPDVAVFTSDILTAPMKISGQPVANLIASTSGTDSDWVVKLIDVYPDEVAGQPAMGGYELMISGDIFRGRYRESLEMPKAIASGQPLLYRFNLPTANHVFLPGHRIMVQIQSSWFPLYDRNPQTFVPNIFWAKPADYRKATQRLYHAAGQTSFIELPLVVIP